MTPELKKSLETLREKFDNLLIREVEVFGGVPEFAGRLGKEKIELREAIAHVLALEEKET